MSFKNRYRLFITPRVYPMPLKKHTVIGYLDSFAIWGTIYRGCLNFSVNFSVNCIPLDPDNEETQEELM
ncbi:hypothetical protein NBRC116188_13370 [Oceaniserpentilla sp. 4NH20-0058]